MITLTIEGWLGSLLGRKWDLDVKNFAELFNALEHNTHKLKNFLIKNKNNCFAIFVDGEQVEKENFLFMDIRGTEIQILPVLAGSTTTMATKIVEAMGMTAAETFAFQAAVFVVDIVIQAVISMGISILITKLMDPGDPDVVNTSSFAFSSAENVASQGQVVPVGYGRLRTGSKIISVGRSSMDKVKFTDGGSTESVYAVGSTTADVKAGAVMATQHLR
tara:strand:- start:86 stop:742 length:657 start_codon:yes stop_codon:yes gene_type:complete